VAGVLAGPLRNSALGSAVAAQVIDAATGATLFARRATELVAPASTSKLLTAAAILTVHKPTDQFVTTVVQGADPSTVVLVGGGDPTLSGAAAGQAAEYDGAARISDLAAAVRKSVGSTPISHVVVDNSLFSGPLTAPGWAAADAPSSYASPITAIMVDAGRDTPDSDLRSGTPDLAAGRARTGIHSVTPPKRACECFLAQLQIIKTDRDERIEDFHNFGKSVEKLSSFAPFSVAEPPAVQ